MQQPYIVALTGHAEDKYVSRALDAEMNILLAKPTRVEDLEDVVKELYNILQSYTFLYN